MDRPPYMMLSAVAHRRVSSYAPLSDDARHPVFKACEVCQTELALTPLQHGCALWTCPGCGHIVRDLELSGASARSHAWGGDAGMDRVRLALTWRRLSKHLSRMQASLGRPLDVLELGYGRGILLHKLLRAGHHVSGVERHLLSTGSARPAIPGATLYDATAEDCILPANRYDFIFAIHVVEHLVDLSAVFRKIAVSLRPGGVFYCMTPNAQSYGLSLFGESWWNMEDPTHYRFFSRRSLETALSRAGFRSARSQIVIEDSVTLEVNSALRALAGGDRVHGILHTPGAKVASLALTPFAVLGRLVVPRLSPSIEAIAVKR